MVDNEDRKREGMRRKEKNRKKQKIKEKGRGEIQDKVILILLNFKVDFDYILKCNFLNMRKKSITMFKS
jgi:hypothetical protein